MRKFTRYILPVCTIVMLGTSSCKKLVEVDEPINSITLEKMFRTEIQAENALAGVYNNLIHGNSTEYNPYNDIAQKAFAGGLSTFSGSLSAGELLNVTGPANPTLYAISTSKLTIKNSNITSGIWRSAYNAIYLANGVIEGASASVSSMFRDSVRKQYIAEAKCLRAFCYFYLTNFYGDLPLALTMDFNQTANVAKTSQHKIYAQIVQDLLEAQKDLPRNYNAAPGKRVRVNYWAATALLARVYLYTKEYEKAAVQATSVINQSTVFVLETAADAFLANSREAIFQLKPTDQDMSVLKNATPEGILFIPWDDPYTGFVGYHLSDALLQSFEQGDQRKKNWIDSSTQTWPGASGVKLWYPAKYKTGSSNGMAGMPQREYSMVLRLAEMYLIRAEARANGADGGPSEAAKDLNVIRQRALVDPLSLSMDAATAKAAVEKERERELFAEWGHRWFDLKRTGKANATLSVMSFKQPWEGDYQLLYPIPVTELQSNRQLTQNFGY